MTTTRSTEPIIAPIVNMNGTSADALVEQIHRAVVAIKDAAVALTDMYPHGRDFQLSPNGAYNTAREQHDQRLRALNVIEDELNAMYMNLYRQRR